jgi:hypothetical protein
MAIAATTVWELRTTATANMVNGGGFNSALGGTDYSLQDTAQLTNTDLSTSGAGATTITSAGSTFTSAMVGNIIHITAGTNFQADWYEIVTFTDANNVVLDRTPSSGGAGSSGTFYVGGALSLNSTLDDDWFEQIPGGNTVYIKSGSYTLGEGVFVSSTLGSVLAPIMIEGYNTTRGDAPTDDNRPVINTGANNISFGQYTFVSYLRFTGTGTGGAGSSGTGFYLMKCKSVNTSTVADRVAITLNSNNFAFETEAVCQRGNAFQMSGANAKAFGCYVHDSKTGFNMTNSGTRLEFCISAGNSDFASKETIGSNRTILNSTLFGAVATPVGVGNQLANALGGGKYINNIFYGLAKGMEQLTAQQKSNSGFNNNFYNCTTDVTNYTKDSTDIAVNPGFVSVTEITGTTATTSGSVLTDSGADFSTVEDGVDYLRVVSGTGVTVMQYLIDSHTSTTLTVNNTLGTSSAGNVVYVIRTGHNFAVGTNLKATGFPGEFPGSTTTGYLDIGAVQREEPAGGGQAGFVIL